MKGVLVGAVAVAVAVVGVAHVSTSPSEGGAAGRGGVRESPSEGSPMMCGRGELFRSFGRQRGECGPVVVQGRHSPAQLQRICDGLAEALRAQGEHPTDCDVTTADGQRVTLPLTPPLGQARTSSPVSL